MSRSECAWWLRCGDKQHVYTSCVQLYSTHCTHWTLSWSWGRASEVRFPSIIHPTVKFIFISGRRCALIERENIPTFAETSHIYIQHQFRLLLSECRPGLSPFYLRTAATDILLRRCEDWRCCSKVASMQIIRCSGPLGCTSCSAAGRVLQYGHQC